MDEDDNGKFRLERVKSTLGQCVVFGGYSLSCWRGCCIGEFVLVMHFPSSKNAVFSDCLVSVSFSLCFMVMMGGPCAMRFCGREGIVF